MHWPDLKLLLFFALLGIGRMSAQVPASVQAAFSKHRTYHQDTRLLSKYYDRGLDADIYHFAQTVNGLDLIDHVTTIVVDKKGELMHTGLRWSHVVDESSTEASVSPISGWQRFNTSSDKSLSRSSKQLKATNSKVNAALVKDEISWREVYVLKDKLLVRCYEYSYYDLGEWKQSYVDVKNGSLLMLRSFTTECSFDRDYLSAEAQHTMHSHQEYEELHTGSCQHAYRVFGRPLLSPLDGLRSLSLAPWLSAPNSSPQGWHDTTITRGNNVYAYEDKSANNLPGFSPNGGADLCFDFPLDVAQPIQLQTEPVIVNMFYWNNMLHDIMYQYGFDEAAGNFQLTNFTNEGLGNDRLLSEAQDGAGINNANFSSPPDGYSPVMQMFLWNGTVNSKVRYPALANSSFTATSASFAPDYIQVSGRVIQANSSDACSVINNAGALDGNIALIDRGGCSFTHKVQRAQAAGAAAVIICNNENSHSPMGGTPDSSILIPAIMMSKSSCDTLKLFLDSLVMDIQFNLALDSGLDNGIIAHEFAHGISIRLTGGPSISSCLNNQEQMGEGWSDWYALMMGLDEQSASTDIIGIGAYVANLPNASKGIRNYPYTTDMAQNPMTYNWIKFSSVPHGLGAVWATMLWDMTWALIEEHGFDEDIYTGSGGNNIALQLVTTALKLQPCAPGFVDGRDAILAADQLLYEGQNKCIIWQSFANRGLGFGANQGSSALRSDGIESFDLPPLCSESIYFAKQFSIGGAVGDTLEVTLILRNNLDIPLVDLAIHDTLSASMHYIDGSLTSGQMASNRLVIDIAQLEVNQELQYKYTCVLNGSSPGRVVQNHNWEHGFNGWSDNTFLGSSWILDTTDPVSGIHHLFVKNDANRQSAYMVSPPMLLLDSLIMSFWHKYSFEDKWDGGVVEITDDNGNNWFDLADFMLKNGYDASLNIQASSPVSGRRAFTSTRDDYKLTIIDLTPWYGKTIRIRFLAASDESVGLEGWYIDDIAFYRPLVEYMNTCLYDDDEMTQCVASRLVIIDDEIVCAPDTLYVRDSFQDYYRGELLLSSDIFLPQERSFIFESSNSIEFRQGFQVNQNTELISNIFNCNNN